MSSTEAIVRSAQSQDTDAVHGLVADLYPLTQHSWYTYWNLLTNFSDSCFVASKPKTDKLVGVFTSHPITSLEQPEWFAWQAGILPDYRGSGLIEQFQERMVEAALNSGAVAIRTTIEAHNIASFKVFDRLARRLGSEVQMLQEIPTPSGIEILYRLPLTTD